GGVGPRALVDGTRTEVRRGRLVAGERPAPVREAIQRRDACDSQNDQGQGKNKPEKPHIRADLPLRSIRKPKPPSVSAASARVSTRPMSSAHDHQSSERPEHELDEERQAHESAAGGDAPEDRPEEPGAEGGSDSPTRGK